MNPYAAAVALLAGGWLWIAPRERAALPLLLGAVWTTTGQAVEIGPAHFTVLRLLVAVGLLRVLLRGERLAGGTHAIDKLAAVWAAWLLASAAFHADGGLVYRAGVAWSELGCYLLLRVFLRDADDVRRLCAAACMALAPVAVPMLVEAATGANLFATLGGVSALAALRDGHLRASGPFGHAILAGSVGACCLALALAVWRTHRRLALLGLFDAVAMLGAARSSGPILMAMGIGLALALWPLRAHLQAVRRLALAACVAMSAAMQDPFYFLLARIDITGGSRGWHRAALIRASIEHLDEWWLAGTDRTRHWMGSGNYVNTNHTDITNHFLAMGVMGGLPLMLLFGLLCAAGFRAVGAAVNGVRAADGSRTAPALESAGVRADAWLAWLLGALLFGHIVNFISVSVFDQSSFFIQVTLAAIGAVAVPMARRTASTTAPARAAGWHATRAAS